MYKTSTTIGRITWLITNELRLKKNMYLIILGACFGILTYLFFNPNFSFGSLLDSILRPSQTMEVSGAAIFINTSGNQFIPEYLKYHLIYFPKALFFVGFLVTSLSFIEYADERSRRFFIALPASQLEKWLAKVIWTAVLFPLVFFLLYHLFALIIYEWGGYSNREYVRISFFDPFIWRQIFLYSAMQCLVFLGAVFFHRYAFVKILLIGLGVYFFSVIFLNLVVYALFPDFELDKMGGYFNRNGYVSYLLSGDLEIGKELNEVLPKGVLAIPAITLFYLVAAVALIVSFIRFKEIEA